MTKFCVNLNIDRMACVVFVYCKWGTQIVKLKICDYTTIVQIFWFLVVVFFLTEKETGIDINENKTKRLKLHKKNLNGNKDQKNANENKSINKLKEAMHPLIKMSKWIVPFFVGLPNRKCEILMPNRKVQLMLFDVSARLKWFVC